MSNVKNDLWLLRTLSQKEHFSSWVLKKSLSRVGLEGWLLSSPGTEEPTWSRLFLFSSPSALPCPPTRFSVGVLRDVKMLETLGHAS